MYYQNPDDWQSQPPQGTDAIPPPAGQFDYGSGAGSTDPWGVASPGGNLTDPNYNPGPEWFWNGSSWEYQGPGAGTGSTVTQPNPLPPNPNPNTTTPPPNTNTGGGNTGGGGGGGAASSGGGGGGGASSTYTGGTIPFTEPGDLPVFDAPEWDAPDPFHYDPKFAAPTADELTADPSFQFRLDQGRKALEASAAGRGLLNSGGTLKNLIDYGSNFATQEYANVYNRKFNEYKFDYDKEADTYMTNYGLSKDAFDRQYKGAFDEFQPKLTGWQTNTNNKARAQEAIFNRDWQMYLADRTYNLDLRRLEQGDWS